MGVIITADNGITQRGFRFLAERRNGAGFWLTCSVDFATQIILQGIQTGVRNDNLNWRIITRSASHVRSDNSHLF